MQNCYRSYPWRIVLIIVIQILAGIVNDKETLLVFFQQLKLVFRTQLLLLYMDLI